MNKIISPVFKSHGQSFLSEDLDITKSLVALKNLEDNHLNEFEEHEYSLAKNILKSISENFSLPFPISNHEKFKILKYDDPLEILKYLVFRNKFYLASYHKKTFEFPTYLLVELVSACNLRCPMCFQSDKSFTKKPFMGIMSIDLAKNILDQADDAKIGAVTFASRGEPMMHPKFNEILRYASSKKNIFELKVNTNGTYLNEKNSRAIFESNVDVIVISADHYEKKLYEKFRLNAKFEDVVERVKNFYNLRKTYSNCKTEIRVSGVNVSKNIDKQKFNDFWIKYADNVSLGDPIERWDTYNNKKADIKSSCAKLWDRMYVWYDGKINPCDEDYKSFLSYGNLKIHTIKEVWKSTALKKLRDLHLSGKRNKIIPCDRCGVIAE